MGNMDNHTSAWLFPGIEATVATESTVSIDWISSEEKVLTRPFVDDSEGILFGMGAI